MAAAISVARNTVMQRSAFCLQLCTIGELHPISLRRNVPLSKSRENRERVEQVHPRRAVPLNGLKVRLPDDHLMLRKSDLSSCHHDRQIEMIERWWLDISNLLSDSALW